MRRQDARTLDNGYASLGWVNTTNPDDGLLTGLFDHVKRVDVMRIDVEVFEPSVIFEGNRSSSLNTSTHSWKWFPHSWIRRSDLGVKGTITFRAVLMHLVNHGYELDSYSKRGDEASSFRTTRLMRYGAWGNHSCTHVESVQSLLDTTKDRRAENTPSTSLYSLSPVERNHHHISYTLLSLHNATAS